MKQFLTFIISTFLLVSVLFGQEKTKYPYEYRLSMKDTLQPSNVSINPFDIKSETTQFSGRIVNSLLLPVIYASITVKGKDSTFLILTDFKGRFSYPLPPGQYTLSVSSLQYSSTSFILVWSGSQGFEYSINLGKKPRAGIYNVYSKIELTQTTLDTIKECLWYNLSTPGSCSKDKTYLVMGQH